MEPTYTMPGPTAIQSNNAIVPSSRDRLAQMIQRRLYDLNRNLADLVLIDDFIRRCPGPDGPQSYKEDLREGFARGDITMSKLDPPVLRR